MLINSVVWNENNVEIGLVDPTIPTIHFTPEGSSCMEMDLIVPSWGVERPLLPEYSIPSEKCIITWDTDLKMSVNFTYYIQSWTIQS